MRITAVDNIIPIGIGKPLSTADRLFMMAQKAELDPDRYKYMVTLIASSDLQDTDWATCGRPSLLTLLGLLELVKSEVHDFFRLAEKET